MTDNTILGHVRVDQAARPNGAVVEYGELKTQNSYRRVPMTPATTELLRDYLAEHPRADKPSAPLFPSMRLTAQRPTGVKATPAGEPASAKVRAKRQADALAELSLPEAEARLVLDWAEPLRHATFYKAVYRPAVLRANRAATATGAKTAAYRPSYGSTRSATPTRVCASRRTSSPRS